MGCVVKTLRAGFLTLPESLDQPLHLHGHSLEVMTERSLLKGDPHRFFFPKPKRRYRLGVPFNDHTAPVHRDQGIQGALNKRVNPQFIFEPSTQ
jgi:hypothetical protein